MVQTSAKSFVHDTSMEQIPAWIQKIASDIPIIFFFKSTYFTISSNCQTKSTISTTSTVFDKSNRNYSKTTIYIIFLGVGDFSINKYYLK